MPTIYSKYSYRWDDGKFTSVKYQYDSLESALSHLKQKKELQARGFDKITLVGENEQGNEEFFDTEELLAEPLDGPVKFEINAVAGGKKRKFEETEPGTRKDSPTGKRRFSVGSSCIPEWNYHVDLRSAELKELMSSSGYALVVGPRQTGKSTMMELEAAGSDSCYLVDISSLTADANVWEIIHKSLHRQQKKRFPLPLEKFSVQTFLDLFTADQPPIRLILDEADKVLELPSEDISLFLSILRSLRQQRHGIQTLILVGTHDLLDIVKHRTWSPSTTSSPFSHALTLHPLPMTVDHVSTLLRQWLSERVTYKLLPSVDAFASHTIQICGNHPGVIGFVLSELARCIEHTQVPLNLRTWSRKTHTILPKALASRDTYARLLLAFRILGEGSLSLIEQVLREGTATVNKLGEVEKELVRQGICKSTVTQREDGRQTHALEISSPLLASSMLTRLLEEIPCNLFLPDNLQSMDLEQFGMFLLTSAFQCIPISALAQANTLTTTKVDGELQPAEYTCQFQVAAKVAAIMRFALGRLALLYVVRREVTGTGERSRKRLDILVGNGSVMRIGHELVVGLNQQTLDDHIQKSHAYAEDHDCIVWVVNFTRTSRDRAHTLKFSHSHGKVRVMDVHLNTTNKTVSFYNGLESRKLELICPLETPISTWALEEPFENEMEEI